MTRTILGMLVGTTFIAMGGVAAAQQTKIVDGNNPSPNYPADASARPVSGNAMIMDGNNPSPNYPAAAAARPASGDARIMDGNNPSPNYPADAKAAPAPRAARHHRKAS